MELYENGDYDVFASVVIVTKKILDIAFNPEIVLKLEQNTSKGSTYDLIDLVLYLMSSQHWDDWVDYDIDDDYFEKAILILIITEEANPLRFFDFIHHVTKEEYKDYSYHRLAKYTLRRLNSIDKLMEIYEPSFSECMDMLHNSLDKYSSLKYTKVKKFTDENYSDRQLIFTVTFYSFDFFVNESNSEHIKDYFDSGGYVYFEKEPKITSSKDKQFFKKYRDNFIIGNSVE